MNEFYLKIAPSPKPINKIGEGELLGLFMPPAFLSAARSFMRLSLRTTRSTLMISRAVVPLRATASLNLRAIRLVTQPREGKNQRSSRLL